MWKALHFLQITAEHKNYPFFTVFLTTKSLSQNISITLLQISLKLHEHRGGYWRKKLPWIILEEQFPVPRNTSVSKIGNNVISLLWQLRCHCNPNHKRFSSLSNTTVGAIFPKLCLWRRSLCSNLGGIGLEKLYRATLRRPTILKLVPRARQTFFFSETITSMAPLFHALCNGIFGSSAYLSADCSLSSPSTASSCSTSPLVSFCPMSVMQIPKWRGFLFLSTLWLQTIL